MDGDDDINPFRTEDDVSPAIEDDDEGSTPQDTDQPKPLSISPLPTTNKPFPSPYTAPQQRTEPCCTRDMWLHSGEDVEILVVDALKTSEGSSSSYIVYVIRTGNVEARRRYSEFESLRTSLVKLYPAMIVPPIPAKQSIGEYAVKQNKAKEDAAMIARRKRMLQVFLNRVAKHPILSNEHVFHRFLDRDVSWSEVLHSPPLSQLPKNILKAPAHNPTDTSSASVYAAIPTPSAAQPLRRPDQRFLDSEAFTNKFANHVSGTMERVTRRTMKRWSEFSHDYSELGAALNGFSLTEGGSLANAMEKTGQAVDATYMSTSKLLQELEQTWYESLQEYAQFSAIIKRLLQYRHQKHLQYELTQELLDTKRESLDDLERNEAEAKRLDTALSGSMHHDAAARRSSEIEAEEASAEPNDTAAGEQQEEESPFPSGSITRAAAPPARRRAPGFALLNTLSHSLQGIIDADPEAARRNGISKTRDTISQLEDALQASAQDLRYTSQTIQADLDRFQRQKVADLRDMALTMARVHRDWCKKNMESWQEARAAVDAIEPHPNRPNAPEVAPAPVQPHEST
ncbi:PX-domain-containing protein [Dacryopinax primogenitus]|uniref:PX-domain-containing protein n=1 Tax=Dacryopinax primogenitus (strain DJM 731) TaxID=1858805 RepID=M5FPT3_DACPD|nr:PX-domain-containing protein [Dacryopinax primogenitus]EJT96584.1 PX-domain-containing protein [Dacryopinax primogenitus]